MIDTPPQIPSELDEADGETMKGRQILSYYVLLVVFLILTRSFLLELNSQFDLAVFPALADGVEKALDESGAFDTLISTIFSLLYAFLFSLPVALVYRVTKEQDRFDPALSQTIVLLAMVVASVIVVISGDLARAFGLAGVVAAVRFRNTLDDAKDAVYVFLAIAIGMACGAKAFIVGLWTSILMTGALYFMWRYQFGRLPGTLLAARDLDKKGKKDKKSKKEKDGKKEKKRMNEMARDFAQLMPEQHRRLAQFAAASQEPGEKKANAGLIIDAREVAPAQAHAEGILGSKPGKWRLAGVVRGDSGTSTLEFVGRMPKKEAPSSLIRALLVGAAAATIDNVEFRPLSGSTPSDVQDATFMAAAKEERTSGSPKLEGPNQ